MVSRILLAFLYAQIFVVKQGKFANALRPSQFNNGPISTPPSSNFDPYSPTSTNSPPPSTSNIPMDNESVEERLSAWRKQQQLKYENQSAIDAANPRDEDGRMKLLASVSKGSISLFFFILMWRSVHHYELADQSFKGTVRLIMVFPTVLLFLGNMIGCVASFMTASSTNTSRKSKKRMKAILNLNKLMELALIVYNIFRLIFLPSKLVLREIYVSRTLTNFLFIIQCQLFTKVTWGAAQISPGGIESNMAQPTSISEGENYDNSYYGGEGYQESPYQEQQQQQQQQQQYNYDESRKQW